MRQERGSILSSSSKNSEMMALSFDSSDGGILSVDSHRVVPAPFLTKTYQLVDDHLTNDIVSWGEDGSTFVVWRPPEFARDLLPNYFKHNNFSSFVRQLNTYGFRKVVPDRWEFANDFFRKGERHLLCEIHRRKAQALVAPGNVLHYGSSLSPSTSGEEHAAAAAAAGWSPLSSSPLPSPRATTAAAAVSVSLSDENERLRRDNCLLLSELARLQKLYDDAVMFLQQHMRLDDLRLVRNHQSSNGLQLQRHFLLEPPRAPPAAPPNENADFCNSRNQRPSCFGGAPGSKFPSEGAAAAAPRASTIDFVDGKLRELAGNNSNNNAVKKGISSTSAAVCVDQDDGKSGPKLFGVVLHGRKRLHPEQQQQQQQQFHNNIEDSFPHPATKSAKTELDLMPHAAAAAATEAPWLRFRASRDERVCM